MSAQDMKVMCLYDELVPIGELIPHPKNRNTHPVDQIQSLANILKYQGWRYPIKVSKRSKYITSGHGRLMAATHNEWTHVPVNYQDYESDDQEYADVQADNAIALWASLDFSGINTDVGDLGPDFNIDWLGIKNFKIDVAENANDPDAVPDAPKESFVKLGDVWRLGEHRLMCGDSTSMDAVERLMDGARADMVWTDPPYNVALGIETTEQAKARNRRIDGLTVMNDKMSDTDFRKFLTEVFTTVSLVTHPGAGIYIAHADAEGYNFRGAARDSGWLIKQCLIWKKSSLVMGRQDYQWIHEPILYGWREGGSHSWYGDRKQTTVLEFDKPSRNPDHPTMKPLELVEYCLNNSSKIGDLILDAFGGSGTTLIAAEKLRRRACLMELDPHYCCVIIERWQQYTGLRAERLEYGETS